MANDDSSYAFLLQKIHRNRGVDFSQYRESTLKRRIERRLNATKSEDYLDYVIYLNKNPAEYEILINALTISFSQFFRNAETFDAIEHTVVPEIIKNKEAEGSNSVTVWSAGTSFGEEAYSIAIVFLEYLKKVNKNFVIKIYGTDIDSEAIEKARSGLYEQQSIRSLDKGLLENYFIEKDGYYQVNEQLKEITDFRAHNVISEDLIMPKSDLILCRNVIIYFTKPLQEMAYSIFEKTLAPKGFLILGKIETISGYTQKSFEVISNTERIYRKLN